MSQSEGSASSASAGPSVPPPPKGVPHQTVNTYVGLPLTPLHADDMKGCLDRVLQFLNDQGIRVPPPAGVTNIHKVLTAWMEQNELPDEIQQFWAGAFGLDVPEQFELKAEAHAQDEDGDGIVDELVDDMLLAAAIQQLNVRDPQPRALKQAKPQGDRTLQNWELKLVRDRMCGMLFPGVRPRTATSLVPKVEKELAKLLAHTGTSPKMDTQGKSVQVEILGQSRVFLLTEFLDWLIEGDNVVPHAENWLRKYARTALARTAYKHLKESGEETTWVAKLGIPHSARAIAFDFSDVLPTKMLSVSEKKHRALFRRVSIARSGGESFDADMTYVGKD